MTSPVLAHYESLLADVYDWMQGGWEARVDANRRFFAEHGLAGGGRAVDLGAGTGYQAVALAGAGYDVVAIDLSPKMLATLRHRADGLPVRCLQGDIVGFTKIASDPADLIVCMGDTLPHLPTIADARAVIEEAAGALTDGGRVVLQLRALDRLPHGDARFLPIRSDADRVFTCFLEDTSATKVRVHDIVHVRNADGGFTQTVSSYDKLRLSAAWLDGVLEDVGLRTTHASETRGLMTRIAGR